MTNINEQTLKALRKGLWYADTSGANFSAVRHDVALIKEAIAALESATHKDSLPVAEPVAWRHSKNSEYFSVNQCKYSFDKMVADGWTPLYSAPQAALTIDTLNAWFSRRLKACGPAGVTDQAAMAEDVMRWTEAQHGIGGKP